MSKHPFPRNSLVSYKGGGYDGCFWEWNYAYTDRDGEFHDLYSSGYKGCETLEKLSQAYADWQQKKQDKRNLNRWSSDGFDTYRLDLKQERERAARELPITALLGIARLLPDDIVLPVHCDVCGETVDARECVGGSPHGVGGIRSEYRKVLCLTHQKEE